MEVINWQEKNEIKEKIIARADGSFTSNINMEI